MCVCLRVFTVFLNIIVSNAKFWFKTMCFSVCVCVGGSDDDHDDDDAAGNGGGGGNGMVHCWNGFSLFVIFTLTTCTFIY